MEQSYKTVIAWQQSKKTKWEWIWELRLKKWLKYEWKENRNNVYLYINSHISDGYLSYIERMLHFLNGGTEASRQSYNFLRAALQCLFTIADATTN